MNKDTLKAFTQKIFDDMAGAMSAGLCYVGIKTGLFQMMAHKGPLTQAQIIQDSTLQPRYVEEWLNAMVCSGYLEYNSVERTYCLPDEHAYLLASEGSDHFAGGLFYMVPAALSVAPAVANAFKHGGGVSFQEYPEELVDAIDLINRGNYEQRFASYWLKSIPGLVEKLEQGASVLDIGCGVGRVSLALAKAFPNSNFMGIDSHSSSIHQAIENGEQQELISRVTFSEKPLNQLDAKGKFDLITVCDCLHDFSDPILMLQEMKACLKPDGMLFIIEPKVADNLEDNCNAIATMLYGFSIFHCMTQSLAKGGLGLGTCMGPLKTEQLVRDAGYSHFETLDIKSKVNLFYVAKP